MAEYSITLPDGTCIEGENHINVVHMAQILRETDDEADEPNSVSIEASSPAGDSNVYIDDVSVGDRYEDEDEDDDDSGFTVPYGGHEITLSGDEGEDSKTLQERVDEAFGSDDDCFSKSIFEHGDKVIQITDPADGTLEQNSGYEIHHSCTEEW